jgi:uncharacterized protein YeaO (DUF488 family)
MNGMKPTMTLAPTAASAARQIGDGGSREGGAFCRRDRGFTGPDREIIMTDARERSDVRLKRAYLPPSPKDGTRILVDRLWPRGLRKSEAAIDRWAKDLAPSTGLRRGFGHDPARWDEFRLRYQGELSDRAAELDELRALACQGPITLVFAARDELHNDAVVLRDLLAG